ncbi:endolytic transglycosylase MltG [Paenisporosarcina cavernae]|uniref:Endolytic murein transglycosylase n=1 Tax=Paenisporosarcina cavernae TaxID=2320858 RepID=A0A385YSB3_9BACL|nr:endolytic transglycosylase MltG [Paenisporosarcina cavernae]AYC29705.1 endolytic transglycosylase MltG [Paenisporosarcina cavernae]
MENESKKEIMFERMKEKKKEVKIVRKIVFIIVLVLFLVVGVAAYFGYNYVKEGLQPVNENAKDIIEINVPIGSNLDSISALLEKNNIIRDARIFKYYAKFNNESDFQAGDYALTQSMTFDELITSLKTGKVYREPVFKLTVREGVNLEEIADIIASKTNYSADEFMDLVTDEGFIEEMKAKYPNLITEEVSNEAIRYNLEGYLFPATYDFYEENPTLRSIVEQMLTATQKAVTPYTEMLAEGQSVHWLLTFASLLEEEATEASDRATIASVFYNRMNAEPPMPLQTDPTVLYSLGSHKDRVLLDDLETESPYNTYLHTGLPPGPIANAGVSSIEAVLNAPDTDFVYFLADSEGKNHFATTYQEHLENKSKYID